MRIERRGWYERVATRDSGPGEMEGDMSARETVFVCETKADLVSKMQSVFRGQRWTRHLRIAGILKRDRSFRRVGGDPSTLRLQLP